MATIIAVLILAVSLVILMAFTIWLQGNGLTVLGRRKNQHRAAIVASWEPKGGFENFLAERVASLSWRLNRVPRYETETTAHHIDTIPDDLAGRGYLRREAGHPVRRDGQHGQDQRPHQPAPPTLQRPYGEDHPLRQPPSPPAHSDHP